MASSPRLLLVAIVASLLATLALAAPLQMAASATPQSIHRRRIANRSSLVSLKLLDLTSVIKNKDIAKSMSLTAVDVGSDNLKVICMTDVSTMCLSRLGSEFVDPVANWDVVAVFEQLPDGKLRRTSDKKCVAAVPQDGATWFDLQFVACTKGSKWASGGGVLSATEAGQPVCLYSEEGYALVDTCAQAAGAPSGQDTTVEIAPASSQVDADKSITAKIQDTMNDVYVGSFWEYAWDMSVGKSLAAADVKQVIDMDKINGFERSLGESVLECRGECDALKWCTGFDFSATDKKCRLTATPKPKLAAKPDAVCFMQNAKYNHADFFLG